MAFPQSMPELPCSPRSAVRLDQRRHRKAHSTQIPVDIDHRRGDGSDWGDLAEWSTQHERSRRDVADAGQPQDGGKGLSDFFITAGVCCEIILSVLIAVFLCRVYQTNRIGQSRSGIMHTTHADHSLGFVLFPDPFATLGFPSPQHPSQGTFAYLNCNSCPEHPSRKGAYLQMAFFLFPEESSYPHHLLTPHLIDDHFQYLEKLWHPDRCQHSVFAEDPSLPHAQTRHSSDDLLAIPSVVCGKAFSRIQWARGVLLDSSFRKGWSSDVFVPERAGDQSEGEGATSSSWSDAPVQRSTDASIGLQLRDIFRLRL